LTTTPFDHHSAEYARDWREINAGLRERCPVSRTAAHGGYWVLSKYADVAEAARDDARYSSYQELPDGTRTGATIPSSPLRQVPIEMDPPEFFAYRKLLNARFSPAAARAREPFLREATTSRIDQVIEAGHADLVRDIANPVPAILTLELLGLPQDDWQNFSDVAHQIVHTLPGTPENDAATTRFLGVVGDIAEAITHRRTSPGDDLISLLATAEIDGEPLTDQRLMEMITLVILGGVDTTGSLIGSALEWLARHPGERDRLRADPELLPQATEEFLRYFSPIPGLARTVTRPCTLGGQEFEAGERLFLSWSSANYDEDVFDDPGRIVLDRFPNRHQAFGLGIHRCIGSNFARAEFRIVVEEVLRRLPDYAIDTAAAEPYPSIGIVNGWVTLPATFTPGPREGSHLPS
jgi:cytochrome P450